MAVVCSCCPWLYWKNSGAGFGAPSEDRTICHWGDKCPGAGHELHVVDDDGYHINLMQHINWGHGAPPPGFYRANRAKTGWIAGTTMDERAGKSCYSQLWRGGKRAVNHARGVHKRNVPEQDQLGQYIRLFPLSIDELPGHPSLPGYVRDAPKPGADPKDLEFITTAASVGPSGTNDKSGSRPRSASDPGKPPAAAASSSGPSNAPRPDTRDDTAAELERLKLHRVNSHESQQGGIITPFSPTLVYEAPPPEGPTPAGQQSEAAHRSQQDQEATAAPRPTTSWAQPSNRLSNAELRPGTSYGRQQGNPAGPSEEPRELSARQRDKLPARPPIRPDFSPGPPDRAKDLEKRRLKLDVPGKEATPEEAAPKDAPPRVDTPDPTPTVDVSPAHLKQMKKTASGPPLAASPKKSTSQSPNKRTGASFVTGAGSGTTLPQNSSTGNVTPQPPGEDAIEMTPVVTGNRAKKSPAQSTGERTLAGSTQRPDLAEFVRAVYKEAVAFTDTTVVNTFQTKPRGKPSPPSAAPVNLASRTIPRWRLKAGRLQWSTTELRRAEPKREQLQAEHWHLRRSQHVDGYRELGTASMEEFMEGLFWDHSQRELEYTPAVYAARVVLDYAAELALVELGDGIGEVRMQVVEMCHKLPWPLAPRCFPVLVLAVRPTSSQHFTIVQIPVDTKDSPTALYSNGRNRNVFGSGTEKKKVVVGRYASVERVEFNPANRTIEWSMATTSDAGGNLPMWLQNPSVPGAIAKDVGLFMAWADKKRRAEK